MAALGFALGDVKLILNSHAHVDHAGGIAELARESGARVVMSPWSADALRNGGAGTADPQFGTLPGYPAFKGVFHLQYSKDRKSTRLTPVTNAHLVCRLLLEKKKQHTNTKTPTCI